MHTVFEASGRNGYYCIDQYKDGRLYRTVESGLTRTQAEKFANELNDAYARGYIDGKDIAA